MSTVIDHINLDLNNDGKTERYDLASGASAVVDGNNLIINNGNVNNLKSSQLVTETMTVTTNAYGWVYFPENLLVITASVTDIYKHLVLDRYERPNGYQYIASTYLETNSNATYTKLASNRTYDVTYTYLKDVPINAGHAYSTEEKVIGTWIDGNPIYEKIVASTNKPSKLNAIESVYELDTNIIPISLNGMAYIDISSLVGYESIVKMPLPSYMQSGANILSVDVNSSNKIEMLITNDTWLNYLSNWILTIQYTKSTD